METSGAKRMYFEFHDHTFIGEFSTANVSFGCKGVMYLYDFPPDQIDKCLLLTKINVQFKYLILGKAAKT